MADPLLDLHIYFSPSQMQSHEIKQTCLRFYKNLLLPNYDTYIKPNIGAIRENHRILIDFDILKSHADKLNDNTDTAICNGSFYNCLKDDPQLVISLLSCAAANCYFQVLYSDSNDTRFKITARIINYDTITSLKDLKSHSVRKYAYIHGTVIRIAKTQKCHRHKLQGI